uniref:Uncharacterized protein n=1 Tax=Arundo donax TaxID=35708 RepID=A0A0A8YQE8_ARUDO
MFFHFLWHVNRVLDVVESERKRGKG